MATAFSLGKSLATREPFQPSVGPLNDLLLRTRNGCIKAVHEQMPEIQKADNSELYLRVSAIWHRVRELLRLSLEEFYAPGNG